MIDSRATDLVSTGMFVVVAILVVLFFGSAVVWGIIRGIRGDDD